MQIIDIARKPLSGYYIRSRRMVAIYNMVETGVNKDLPNWCNIALMGTVQRLEPCTNFWVATMTDVNANVFEM
jgi:hypothetical protein